MPSTKLRSSDDETFEKETLHNEKVKEERFQTKQEEQHRKTSEGLDHRLGDQTELQQDFDELKQRKEPSTKPGSDDTDFEKSDDKESVIEQGHLQKQQEKETCEDPTHEFKQEFQQDLDESKERKERMLWSIIFFFKLPTKKFVSVNRRF